MWMLVVIAGLFFGHDLFMMGRNHFDFVAGKYGKYCYEKANQPESIKYPRYFETYEECMVFVEQNRIDLELREAEWNAQYGTGD